MPNRSFYSAAIRYWTKHLNCRMCGVELLLKNSSYVGQADDDHGHRSLGS
jgi:hypothetical protein